MKRIFLLLVLVLNINLCLGTENIDILYKCIKKIPTKTSDEIANIDSRKNKCYTNAIKRIVKRCNKKIQKNTVDPTLLSKSKQCFKSEINSVQDKIKKQIELGRKGYKDNYDPEDYDCDLLDYDCRAKEYPDKVKLGIEFYYNQIKFIKDRCSIYDKSRDGFYFPLQVDFIVHPDKVNKFVCEIQELYQFDQFLRGYESSYKMNIE